MFKKYTKLIFVTLIFLICIGTLFFHSQQRAEQHFYNHSFDDVVNYFSYAFNTNIIAIASDTNNEHIWIWGPWFLTTNTIYTVDIMDYIPSEQIILSVWFAQIGGEYNTFTIRRIDTANTSISLSQQIKFFFPIPFKKYRERQILNEIQKDIERK